jgi:hypothetical protein
VVIVFINLLVGDAGEQPQRWEIFWVKIPGAGRKYKKRLAKLTKLIGPEVNEEFL